MALPRRFLPLLVAVLAACTSSVPATPSPSVSVTALPPTPASDTPLPGTPAPPASATPAPSPTAPPTDPPSPTTPPTLAPTASPTDFVPGSPSPPSAAQLEQLQATIDAERAVRGMPGLAAVVVFGDGTRWAGATGSADVDPEQPATSDTPFVVGSITKTFVAATVMQLVEEGVLTLEDPLSGFLPDYPLAESITLRQLLNHTAGVFNYFEHPRYNEAVFGDPTHEWTPDEVLRRFRRAGHFPPGQGYYYSNTGFILLGLVIEEATGAALGDELRRRFFEPLGMDDTWFQGDGPPPDELAAAQGYLRRQRGLVEISDGSGYRPTTSAATVAWAAGGIVSSANDLATWARALYGGAVVGPASLHEMTNVVATPYAGGTYGLGTRTRLVGDARAFGHTGSLRGFQAAMWHLPAENVTFVVLSNLGRVDVNPTVSRLAGVVFP